MPKLKDFCKHSLLDLMEQESKKVFLKLFKEEKCNKTIFVLKINLELLLEFYKVNLIKLKDKTPHLELMLIAKYLKFLEIKKYQYTKLLEILFI